MPHDSLWKRQRPFKDKPHDDNDNSKTAQDRRIVSIKVEYDVVCALSNGYFIDDLV